jgi:CHAT domain-containing protein
VGLVLGVFLPACQTTHPIEGTTQHGRPTDWVSDPRPPRGVQDIIDALYAQRRLQPLQFDPAEASKTPPDTADRNTLTQFYFRRALAAREVLRGRQEFADLIKAAEYASPGSSPPLHVVWNELANVERKRWNFSGHIDYLLKSLATVPRDDRGWLVTLNSKLVMGYAATGHLKAAEEALGAATSAFAESFTARSSFSQKPESVLARQVNLLVAEAALAEAMGQYGLAETRYRRAIALYAIDAYYARHPIMEEFQYFLVRTLIGQGRLLEAEVEARKAVLDALGKTGRLSRHTPWVLRGLIQALLEQGRYRDAEVLARESININEGIGSGPDSAALGVARAQLAIALSFQRRDQDALVEYKKIGGEILDDPVLFEHLLGNIGDYAEILIRAGDVARALDILRVTLDTRRKVMGASDRGAAELQGLLARAHLAQGDRRLALSQFREAATHLLTRGLPESDETTTPRAAQQRVAAILTSYIGLLADISGTPLEREAGIDAVAESFRLADLVRWQSVQRALNASAVRAAAKNSMLADLVRRNQDARRQADALYRLLGTLVSEPIDQQNVQAIADLRARIDVLRRSIDELTVQIERDFPAYAELTQPKPFGLPQARAALRRNEALITTLVSLDHTFVWALAEDGSIAFASVAMGARAMEDVTSELRRALDPGAKTLDEIPAFDLDLAHRLYRTILDPVRSGWQHARSLLVVADGPLSQLPLALLPTAPVTRSGEPALVFSSYRDAPWLIRSHAITMLPSVASLGALRTLPPGNSGRLPFVGFGDPHFSVEQQPSHARGKNVPREAALTTRAVPVTLRASPKNLQASQLAKLPPLPDTADEILRLADVMHADPRRDVFLGARANERTVKNLDLARYRVVAFATHGLVPGDIEGLTQPALALSAPSVADVDGDGLLTIDEILGLRLDADWVVLSACNTASGEGSGAESLSGLGRAFFYAGTRALLVSNWPVETLSAGALTTDILGRQQRNPSLSRAEALQQAMNWLIDHGEFVEAKNGTSVFSYAHPIFWAPFTLIGDGAGAAGR